MSKKILVAGGSGFLGSHLCRELLKLGNQVICIDNNSTGNLKNIEDLVGDDFTFISHDVVNPISIDVDEIYNLACPASPPKYQKDPIKTAKTSMLGAINLLDLAVTNKARIFQASTSEVYGDPSEHPQSESYWGNVNPIGIRSCYDEGKRIAETLFFDYQREYNIDIKVARIFNTYGPYMDENDGRVVSNFINQALQNKDITIYGKGGQTRSFCFVSDLIAGIIKLMNSDCHGPVNLGNPDEFTISELAKTVINLTGSKSKIVYLPLPADDPKKRKPDITFARESLDWYPGVNLKDGLKETIKYFESIQ